MPGALTRCCSYSCRRFRAGAVSANLQVQHCCAHGRRRYCASAALQPAASCWLKALTGLVTRTYAVSSCHSGSTKPPAPEAPAEHAVPASQIDGVQPMVTIEDCIEAEEIFQKDPNVQRLCRERYGIENVEDVVCDPWYYGERFSESFLLNLNLTAVRLLFLGRIPWRAMHWHRVRWHDRSLNRARNHVFLSCSRAGHHGDGRPLHPGAPRAQFTRQCPHICFC